VTIFTTSTLLTELKRRAMLSPSQLGLTDADLLALATTEMQSNLVPLIVKQHSGYLLYTDAISVSASATFVRFPERCVGQTLRHLYWVDAASERYDLAEYRPDDLVEISGDTAPYPTKFVVEGSRIRLFPTPTAAGTLYVTYAFRPNDLCVESSARRVTAVDSSARTVTLASTPSAFTTSVLYDIVQHRSGNECILHDLTATDISSNVITFAVGTDLSNVEVNNWVSLTKTSPVPMLPEDLHNLLIEMTVGRLFMMRGMKDQATMSAASVKQMREQFLPALTNARVVSKPRRLGGNNPFLR